MDKFNCERCGACCRNIDKSIHFAALDKGDGVCLYLDEESNLCSIYENRPLLCNVDLAYKSYFQNFMSLEDYYAKNYKACELLKNIIKEKG